MDLIGGPRSPPFPINLEFIEKKRKEALMI